VAPGHGQQEKEPAFQKRGICGGSRRGEKWAHGIDHKRKEARRALKPVETRKGDKRDTQEKNIRKKKIVKTELTKGFVSNVDEKERGRKKRI